MSFSIIFVFLYIAFIVFVVYVIVTWVNKFISLKQEHNQLLREILHKMDKGQASNL